MKKTIQTNIAGVVFNIEEDAYEKLNSYLRAIQQYFSKYEGSKEIVTDIETRIAEKFFDKQRVAGGGSRSQQVITIEQVNQVVGSMGSVSDFEAIEEDEDLKGRKSNGIGDKSQVGTANSMADAENSNSENPTTKSQHPTSTNAPQRFFRDTKRKALGGVLAGFAYHFNIDVVWLRLIFMVLFLGVAPLSHGDLAGISGILFIAYIVCWIAFPANNTLEEDSKIKKFYRNPDQKVVGGVASGLAAYFGIDLGVMRFLFVLGIFLGGIGLITYLLLWIVAPKATTLTQKMEMKGEPVTLSNIETNIKSSLDINPNAPETTGAKLLLLPFRAIGAVMSALGEVFKNLGPVVRIFTGIVLIIIAISWMFVAIVGAAVFFGVASHSSAPWIHFGDLPLSMLAQDIHPMLGVLGFLVCFLPAFAIGLIGASLLTGRTIIGNRTYWLTGLGLWIVSCLSFGTMFGQYMLNFARHGEHEVTKNFTVNNKTLVLDANESDSEFFDDVSLDLEGYEGSDFKLIQTFAATGHTRSEAEKNAENTTYQIAQKDSVLIFDGEVAIPANSRFRKQSLDMKLYLPYNQPFTMTDEFANHLLNNRWDLFDKYDFDSKTMKNFRFVMKKDSGIICLNCKLKKDDNDDSADNSDNNKDNSSDETSNLMAASEFNSRGDNERSFNLSEFQKIEIGSAFVVNVQQGNNFSVKADGDEKDAIDDLKAKVEGNTLKIYYDGGFLSGVNIRRKQVRINIIMPKLEYAEFSGASKAKITGFKDNSNLTLHISGATEAVFDGKVNELNAEAGGASTLELLGSAENLKAEVSGASHLNAKNMKITKANAEASGASSATFGQVSDFHSNTSGASSVTRE